MKKSQYGRITISEDVDLDGMLAQLPIELRNKGASKAVRAATKVVSTAYKGRVARGKTGNLKRSIGQRVKTYQGGRVWVGIAGARRPTGNHAHLIELGHKVNRRGTKTDSAKWKRLAPLSGSARVEGKFDLVAAIDTTTSQQDNAVIDSLVESIKEAKG